MSTIKNVFNANVSNLNELLQGNVEEFAKQMLQEDLIRPAVAHNSKDTTIIIDNCLARMPFLTSQQIIEEHCGKFLQVLNNIGEQQASEHIKKQLIDKVEEKLNINFNL